MEMFKLDGKVALITGSSKGLGFGRRGRAAAMILPHSAQQQCSRIQRSSSAPTGSTVRDGCTPARVTGSDSPAPRL